MNHYRIALAGNPNTGKSTLFNLLTGMRQHTGNWPGKTVTKAEGTFETHGDMFHLIDLPGTYSLLANSVDEEVARDYLLFDQPDATLVVVDATAMERNLNLALQVIEMTPNVILCINLIDEAERKGILINEEKISQRLGVPVVKLSAINGVGLSKLFKILHSIVTRQIIPTPSYPTYNNKIENHIKELEKDIQLLFGTHLPSRWIALRLLDGDTTLINKLQKYVQLNPKGGEQIVTNPSISF